MAKTIDILIKKMGGSLIGIYEYSKKTDPDSGSDIFNYSKNPDFQILGYIQPTGGQGSVKGIQLKNTSSGDEVYAECFMYHSQPVTEKSRLDYEFTKYEIRSTEAWNCSFMKYYISYLVKVDGQHENNTSKKNYL